MKQGISGSIVNEIEVNERWELQRQTAQLLLVNLKAIEKDRKKTYIRVNHYTFKTDGFDELMERKKKVKVIFKRNE